MIDVEVMQDYIRDANPIPCLDDLDPEELAVFVAAAHTRRAVVMQAPTQHPTPTSPVTRPPRRRRKAWAFAAAFILIFVAVGIAALVNRAGDESPVAEEPIDVEALTWSRVPHDEAVFRPGLGRPDVMRDVTVGGPGFVAVGTAIDGVSPRFDYSAVWTSEDGITWSLLPNGEPPLDGWMIRGVTVGGPGLVAVGFEYYPPGTVPIRFTGGTVWTSEDGISWAKDTDTVRGANSDLIESSTMHDVTAGGPGLIAVGAAGWEPGPAVWTSVDGMSWTRVPVDQDVFGEWGPYGWSMAAVTAGGPGFIAVGRAPYEQGPAVWTSPDGLTWTVVPPIEVPGDGIMLDVVAGGPGLVAVGATEWGNFDFPGSPIWGEGGGGAAVWTSPDGFTWTLVPPSELPASEAPLQSVITVGSQLVAVGDEVWTSVDGVTWTEAGISGGGTMHSVAVTDDGLIAVGEQDRAAAVWIAAES